MGKPGKQQNDPGKTYPGDFMLFSCTFVTFLAVVKASIFNLDVAFSEKEKDSERNQKFCPTVYQIEGDVRAIGVDFYNVSLNESSGQMTRKRKSSISENPSSGADPDNTPNSVKKSNEPIHPQAFSNSPSSVPRVRSADENAELENFLANEVITYKYNKNSHERRVSVRMMITHIANNDLEGYGRDHDVFKRLFSHNFNRIKKSGVPFFNYYAIYFGATNFKQLLTKCGFCEFEQMRLREAFVNLIEKNPFHVISYIMSECYFIPEEERKIISERILAKFPELTFFDCLIFELPHDNDNVRTAYNIQFAKFEPAKLNIVKNILMNNIDRGVSDQVLLHFGYKRLLHVLDYPDFFKSLRPECRFLLAKIAVLHSNSAALIRITELDGSLILANFDGSNLFDVIISNRKLNFMPFILAIAHELAFVPKGVRNVSIYESLIIDDDVEMIKAFENHGLSSEFKYINGLNAIQMAYQRRSNYLLLHFSIKYGNVKMTGYLSELSIQS